MPPLLPLPAKLHCATSAVAEVAPTNEPTHWYTVAGTVVGKPLVK